MHASVRALLSGIIDYAGLFPPAKLPLEEALRNYLHYRKESPYRWMLGRFVCPVGRLQESLTLAKSHSDELLLSVSALGRQTYDKSEFLAQFESDMKVIQDLPQIWGIDSAVGTYETLVPVDLAAIPMEVRMALDRNQVDDIFLEIPATPRWRNEIRDRLARLLPRSRIGLKLRTGGVSPDAFPSDGDVAFFIDHCRHANARWKATAGLHHPRRFWDESLKVWHHGFLNIFTAAVLAGVHQFGQSDIAAILADRPAEHLHFDDDRLSWKGWSCTVRQIIDQRRQFATSFGCCTFDEPVEELLAMGLLDRA